MTQRISLGVIAAAALVLGLSYASAFLPGGPPAWIGWPFALATSASLTAAMVLGASRPGGGVGRLAVPFAAVFALLVTCFGLALLEPVPAPGDRLWFGLPKGAALVLYGVGLLPLLVLPLAYALTFESQTLNEGDLERVRREAAALRAAETAAAAATLRRGDDTPAAGHHPFVAPRTTETV